jgi:hypothetical protein
MKNWLGQRIKVGDVVWRGARDVNTSSFKVGRVKGVAHDRVHVNWMYENLWRRLGTEFVVMPTKIDSNGLLKSANSLVVIHPDLLAYAEIWNERVSEYNATGDETLLKMIIEEFGEEGSP